MWRRQLASAPQVIYAKGDLSLCSVFVGPHSQVYLHPTDNHRQMICIMFLFRSEMYNVHLFENKTTATVPAAGTAIIYKITVAWIGVSTEGFDNVRLKAHSAQWRGCPFRPTNTNNVMFNMALRHLALLSTNVISSMCDNLQLYFLE